MKKIALLFCAVSIAFVPLVTPAASADPNAAMEAYRAVLKNEMEFYSVDENKSYKLNEFDCGEGEPIVAERFAVVDMDDDGMPEVVLDFQRTWVGVEVLHYEDGKVYGFNRPYMPALARDGTYDGNASFAPYNVQFYKTTSVKKGAYKVEPLAYIEYKDDGGNIDITSYRIGESKVSEEEFNAFVGKISDHIQENEAVWHDFTDADIASVFK